ncbi:MAG: FAD:protein FMN transferase [Armatimonas sp.]
MWFGLRRRYTFCYENVLGTSFRLEVQARSKRIARAAESAALAEIDRLEPILSSYDPQSELSRWQQAPRGVETPLSGDLLTVLTAAEYWHQWSDGAFHPGAESLTRLWKEAALAGVQPDEKRLQAVREKLAAPLWTLDPVRGTGTLLTPCALSLNALAKGYIVDCAAQKAFGVSGVEGVLLEIGGDLRVLGNSEQQVGITDPRRDSEGEPPLGWCALKNAAAATSGGYRRGFVVGETILSHLLDPRSGLPAAANTPLSVTVVAPDAMAADALSTAASLLPVAESLERIARLPGCGIFVLDSNGNGAQSGVLTLWSDSKSRRKVETQDVVWTTRAAG